MAPGVHGQKRAEVICADGNLRRRAGGEVCGGSAAPAPTEAWQALAQAATTRNGDALGPITTTADTSGDSARNSDALGRINNNADTSGDEAGGSKHATRRDGDVM